MVTRGARVTILLAEKVAGHPDALTKTVFRRTTPLILLVVVAVVKTSLDEDDAADYGSRSSRRGRQRRLGRDASRPTLLPSRPSRASS